MIVPQYWAEAKVKDRISGAQVTIKRFGWSDDSEAAAEAHARQRAEEAMTRARAGERVRRVDHKLTYNGAEGLPIREEVVSRDGETVMTRNVYGALCLNTPDVLFADIDFPQNPPTRLTFAIVLIVLVLAAALAVAAGSGWLFVGVAGLGLWGSGGLARTLVRWHERRHGGQPALVRSAVETYAQRHPDVHLRLYRTPMGYRVLAMHTTYDPMSEDSRQLLLALKADPLYLQMCRNQKCFRARVSPKPWRIGLERLTPRPGIWPIRPERMPARNAWIQDYSKKARDYAACRFEASYGSRTVDPKAERVRVLHDRLCQAHDDLKLA
ncbi:hypothetical protein [Marinobacter zhejiangensis]|uniref:Transmembrane protein n=1 Tax=Marinobacter zhejiangensis TaxID=488535 RepID=A0A1I4SZ42_9GAMM|nr:hypothetical protein [Marinobacter zhejiangensis]SFM69732.1 hypothetical protein SAMN04487963_3400 [Marinobacter zhejiangensis]